MTVEIDIELDRVEGALLRIIGTAERRGFSVLGCRVEPAADGRQRMRLSLEGARDAEVLCRQLGRLIDVRGVRVCDDAAAAVGREGERAYAS